MRGGAARTSADACRCGDGSLARTVHTYVHTHILSSIPLVVMAAHFLGILAVVAVDEARNVHASVRACVVACRVQAAQVQLRAAA
jgi:hypothetical protein